MPMGILSSKVRYWSLPQLLLITVLLLLMHIIINIWHNYYVYNKDLLDELRSGRKCGSNRGLLLLPVWKVDFKAFSAVSRIRTVTARTAPTDKYPVNTSHRSRFV